MAIVGCGRLLNADKTTAQLFKINFYKDTALKILQGAFHDIPKGFLSSSDSLNIFRN